MMEIQIIIAMHKPYPAPSEACYLPLWVGAEGKETPGGIRRDDEGENISRKNDTYCELTGLYWAWKHLDCDAVGLVHYRRHFTCKGRRWRRRHADRLLEGVLTQEEAASLLARYDILVPSARRYYIETLYSHYAHTLDAVHLDVAREVLKEEYPAYADACDRVYAAREGHMFNMFVMKRERLEEYCAWLFPILEEMERRIDLTGLSGFERRVYGRVSEILFNVWLQRQKEGGAPVGTVPWMSMEPVNWLKKGTAFLMAKFFGKKYEESF